MEHLLTGLGVVGWLIAGILVNKLLDIVSNWKNEESPIRGDPIGVFVATLVWPVVLAIILLGGVIAGVFFLYSWKPFGKRNEPAE